MFTSSRSIDDRATATGFDSAYQKYAAAEDSWFDGTPHSVDSRLIQCRRLMNFAKAHIARRGAEVGPLSRLASLEVEARALEALRDDLLTAAADREDNSPIAGVRIAGDGHNHKRDGLPPWDEDSDLWNREAGLQPQDHRFVTLEASRFLADNTDTDDVRELATRAKHFAEKFTSTYSADHSRNVTTAFVSRVAKEASRRSSLRRQIEASRGSKRYSAHTPTAIPAEAMFL